MVEQASEPRASIEDGADTRKPHVSVCVLSYNHAPFIEQALRSVLEQTASFSIEVVLVDDCSTDGTSELAVEILRNSGVHHRVLRHERNLGVRASFIELLRSARGEYIAFLESDDYWLSSSKLEEQVALLDSEPRLVGCFGRSYVVDSSDRVVGEYFEHHRSSAPSMDVSQRIAVQRGSSGPAGTYLFRREAIDPMPAWFLSVASHQALLVVLTEHGGVRFVDRNWGNYRIHAGGVWSSATRERRIAADFRYAVALASDPVLAHRYPQELGTRLALTALSLGRARAREGFASFARMAPDLWAAANTNALRTVLSAVPDITRVALTRLRGLLTTARHE